MTKLSDFIDVGNFDEKMKVYSEELSKLLREEEELKAKIKEVFEALGYKLEV